MKREQRDGAARARFGSRLAVASVVAAVLVAHFTVTLLYLTPLNPIKARFLDRVNGYMSPYFTQTWELFGPNPNGRMKDVWISCRLGDGPTATETAWYDITTPMMRVHHAYRLSAAQRLLRAETPTYQLFLPEDQVLKTIRKLPKSDHDAQEAVRQIEAARDKEFKLGLRIAGRFASGYCDRLFGNGRASAVRTRVLFQEPPEFRNRSEPNGWPEPRVYDTEWLPYERVAPRI